MGDCVGGWSGELTGEKLCKIIENGELVRYSVRDKILVKEVYNKK
jgi:hypothetical protein